MDEQSGESEEEEVMGEGIGVYSLGLHRSLWLYTTYKIII